MELQLSEAMTYVAYAVLIGSGATAVMDLWGLARQRLFGTPPPDYGLVGRWIAYLLRGQFRHERIAASPAVRGERLTGWIAHYLIGIVFAALLLSLYGLDWVRLPSPGPALIVGLATVAAPFLIMQPGMGAGIAARRSPRPNAARLQSLINHAVFGLGLYLAAQLLRAVLP